MGRNGILFSLDALIAVMLIIVVIILMPMFYLRAQDTTSAVYYSSDMIQLLSDMELREFDDADIAAFLNNTNVTDFNRTVVEQILRFQIEGSEQKARQLLNLTIGSLIPNDYSIGIWVEGYDDPIFTSTDRPVTQLISSKQMVTGMEKDRAVEGLTSRVFLSEINERTSAAYLYFGGYIGEGNITGILSLPISLTSIDYGYMELDAGSSFELYVNGNFSGSYAVSPSPAPHNLTADKWVINESYLSNFDAGDNIMLFSFNSTKDAYIGGGYFKLKFQTSELGAYNNITRKRYFFPGIDGIINIYDSFYIPGMVNNINMFLHFMSNTPVYFTVGNVTVFETSTSTVPQSVFVNDSVFSAALDYNTISKATVPIRLGIENITFFYGGKSDAVLITDRTGSMRGCDVDIDCSEPGICDGSSPCHERRDRVAQGSDKTFVEEMLSVPGNEVSLVGYGKRTSPVCSFHPFSGDNASLQSRIDDYYDEWCGWTCISCGINTAAELLTEKRALYGSEMKVQSDSTARHLGDTGPVSAEISFNLDVNKSAFVKSRLTLFGRGVDVEDGYRDCVFLNGHYLGRMCESNDDDSTGWHTCSYPIKEEWLPSSGIAYGEWSTSSQADFQACSESLVDVMASPGDAVLKQADAWWDSAWLKRRKIAFDNSGQGELPDFPVLVRLDSTRIDYSETQDMGQDIRFVDDEGAQLAHEIEEWDEGGSSYVWVRASIDGYSDTGYIWVYYGNNGAPDDQDAAAVWDDDFIGVYHMDDDQDSSSFNNDLGCGNCPGSSSGIVDGAYDYDGNNDYSTIANSDEINDGGPWDDKTIEVLFRADTIDGGAKNIIYEQGGGTRGLNIYLSSGNAYVGGWNRDSGQSDWDGTWLSTGIGTGEWHYVALRLRDGTDNFCGDCFEGYLDGTEFGAGEGRRLYAHSGDIRAGYGNTRMHDGTGGEEELDGMIDELRLSNAARSDDWIAAQYLSMNDSFLSFGPEMEEGDLTSEYSADGWIMSPVYYAGGDADWGSISWENELPAGTSIYLEIRTGDVAVPDGSWDNFAWSSAAYDDAGPIAQADSRYIQWRANLSTANTSRTPVLESVKINYSVANTGTNNITVTGANVNGCFDTAGEQDDWDLKHVELIAWEHSSEIHDSSFSDPSLVVLDDGAESSSVVFNTGIGTDQIRAGLLRFEALDVNPDSYDCVYVNGQYIGRIDYQRWSGDNEWQEVLLDVPVMVLNSSDVEIRLFSGTTTGCLHTDDDNDLWRFRNLNLTLKWSDDELSYDRFMSMLVMSDGEANTRIGTRSNYDLSGAEDEAVQKACDAFDRFGIRIYSVAFGSGADTGLMDDIACCDDCSHAYDANDAAQLMDIYRQIASDMIELQFAAQTANVTGNVSNELYPDSYIEFNYSLELNQTEYARIPVIVESPRFSNNITQGSFTVPPQVLLYDAKLTSYSGERWTDRASVWNGSAWDTFYNISDYGVEYSYLGDPYIVNIPVGLLGPGNNTVRISTAQGSHNVSIGSADDMAIYTIGIRMDMNYTGVFAKAEGCIWTLGFEDGTYADVPIPNSYNSSANCTFNAFTSCDTDYDQDAINNAICRLFDQLDFDDDGLLFVKFGANDLDVETVSIGRIPFMWGPTIVEARVWRWGT